MLCRDGTRVETDGAAGVRVRDQPVVGADDLPLPRIAGIGQGRQLIRVAAELARDRLDQLVYRWLGTLRHADVWHAAAVDGRALGVDLTDRCTDGSFAGHSATRGDALGFLADAVQLTRVTRLAVDLQVVLDAGLPVSLMTERASSTSRFGCVRTRAASW